MSDRPKIRESMGFNMNRHRLFADDLNPRGIYVAEHLRNGKILGIYDIQNIVMNAAKDDLWDVYFSDGTQKPSTDWCMGLISSVSYTAIAAANTMASHSGWTEYTAYDQTVRVAWGPGAPSAQAITNGTPCTFDFNATGTVKGIFIASEDTKSGTTGILWSAGLFASDVPVVDEDQIRLTYAVSI